MSDQSETVEIGVQNADQWSTNAKQYKNMASKIPIVHYFSDMAAVDLANVGELHLLANGGTFLDVCAGPAVFSIAVLKKIGIEQSGQIKFIISDFSAGMIDAAKEAVEALVPSRPNTHFQLMDVQNIELPTDSVDVVGCMFGYFVPDRLKAFAEVCRVCKPGGRAVVGTWKYAGYAYILGDFLLFLGVTRKYNALELAHVCADGDALRTELLSSGFSEVVVHEHSNVFELSLSGDAMIALFENPMIKTELSVFDQAFVLSEWARFVRQEDFKYETDIDRDVLFVTYTANIAIAKK